MTGFAELRVESVRITGLKRGEDLMVQDNCGACYGQKGDRRRWAGANQTLFSKKLPNSPFLPFYHPDWRRRILAS
ncbi:MAG: hypothetical protein Q8861_06945 [Bacteroidota bacterium]|nr:hypothetical protein [Bacteroidota bacterium]